MKTRQLNIQQAYELYTILKPIFPEVKSSDGDLLDFSQELIQNMLDTDPQAIVEILALLSEEEPDKIVEAGEVVVLETLLTGLVDNKVASLIEFFDSVIFNG